MSTNQSFNMSPARAGSSVRAVDAHNVEAKLRAELDFLQKKIKYIQSVSTIFRQKIALIMRECSKNPNSFADYHKMYAKVLGEVTRAEEEIDQGAAFAAIAAPTNADGTRTLTLANRTDAERRQRRDDVEKAHHLCAILAEKNEIKAREIDLRDKYEQLQSAYDDIRERYSRLIELQSSGSGGLAQAQTEAFRERERHLEKALVTAKADLAAAIARGNSTTHTNSLADGVAFASDATHAKQNALLKSRVDRLKKELAAQTEEHEKGTKLMQLNVETLVAQLHSVKRENETKDIAVKHAQNERIELEGELNKERQIVGILQSKCASLEREVERLSSQQDQQPHRAMTSSASHHGGQQGTDAADLLDTFKARADDWEARARALQDQLWALEAASSHKDTEIAALGSQIRAFRARVDAFEAERDQRDVQRVMVHEVESRILSAVKEIQQSQTTSALSEQMGGINQHLKRLEGLELQLRQKEDLLAMSEDDLAQVKATHRELLDSLAAVSSLFTELPHSVASLERLVIEHGEYKGELFRCADARELPDVVSVQGRIELRCLEAEAARKASRNGTNTIDNGVHQPSTAALLANAAASPAGQNNAFSPRRAGDFLMDSAIPSPPPLLDLTASLHGGGNFGNLSRADPESIDFSNWGGLGDMSGYGGAGAAGGSHGVVTDDDVRITFQLFDERGLGVLGADVIRLCLTTLGLSPSLLPPKTKSMTAAEFTALCVNRPRVTGFASP